MEKFKYNTIDEAIAAIKAGQMVLVTDDEDRENEGDLIMAAELCTPEAINFMAKEARGLICMPADSEVMDKLQFGAMVTHNTDNHETAFSVSIDHVDTTTGISAYERAYTMKKCAEPGAQPSDFRRPGHVFPLRARKGGVLVRTGHTETTVDLCKLAGLQPVGICCEIMNDDGHMARTPDLIEFAKKHKLVFINYAKTRDTYVAYRKAGYSKKSLSEHEPEIILHKAAEQFFDEQGLKKLPTVKSLQAEYAQLLEYVRPDIVHVLKEGRIVRTGGREIVEMIEKARETVRLYARVKQIAMDMVKQGMGFGMAEQYQFV